MVCYVQSTCHRLGLKLTAYPKPQTKDFLRFLGVVVILYIGVSATRASFPPTRADLGHQGFLTTFTLLARDHFTLSEMSWLLIQVFLG